MTETDLTDDLLIEREVDAPIDLVWQMWTVPDHFKAWYGPGGASIPVAEFDVRVGGRRFVAMEMQTPNGPMRMHFVGKHVEVDQPTTLAYTESMADADGNALDAEQAGMPPGHPAVTEVRVQLTDIGGRTGLTLTHAGVPADSPGAQGWNMALDKLVAHAAGASG